MAEGKCIDSDHIIVIEEASGKFVCRKFSVKVTVVLARGSLQMFLAIELSGNQVRYNGDNSAQHAR